MVKQTIQACRPMGATKHMARVKGHTQAFQQTTNTMQNKSPKSRKVIRIIKLTLLSIISLLVLVALATYLFFYLIFNAGDVELSSDSPSGKLTFTTHEGCLGHACSHTAKITNNTDDHSEYCQLGIIADYPVFTSGSSLSWNQAETIVNWKSASGDTGRVNVKTDCSRRNVLWSSTLDYSLSIKESCI